MLSLRLTILWLLLLPAPGLCTEIGGPEKVAPGTLVVLSVDDLEGKAASWIAIEPVDLTYQVFEDGKHLAFSSGVTPGTRIIVLTTIVSWKKQTLEQLRQIVYVDGPGPGPEPGPEPGPTPLPDGVYGLAQFTYDEAMLVPASYRTLAGQMGGYYATASTQIRAGVSVAAVVKELYRANSDLMDEPARVAWNNWRLALQAEQRRLRIGNAEHAQAFEEMSLGLKAVR